MPYSGRYFFNLYDLVDCITKAIDLINPEISNHHQQVAYLAYHIAEQLHCPIEQLQTLVLAALLHDIGALPSNDRLDFAEGDAVEDNHHAFVGAGLLAGFPRLKNIAEVVRFHHIPWKNGKGQFYHGRAVSPLSHILHLSDRISVQINRQQNIISQVGRIKKNISEKRGTFFPPEAVDAFLAICDRESLWLGLTYQPGITNLPNSLALETIKLTLDDAVDLTKIFSYIIDFRSPFTAMHSAGVAAVAKKLAELTGFSGDECKMMSIAGHLHDIGKLVIPKRILEKHGRLEPEEFDIIKSHSYYTYRLLSPIRGFEIITQWAAFHHERLDGHGYPFHLKANSLSLGSRIMAVADIFTAITEDRPYRKGMPEEEAKTVLAQMAENGGISPRILSLLLEHYQMIIGLRREAAETEAGDYRTILSC